MKNKLSRKTGVKNAFDRYSSNVQKVYKSRYRPGPLKRHHTFIAADVARRGTGFIISSLRIYTISVDTSRGSYFYDFSNQFVKICFITSS